MSVDMNSFILLLPLALLAGLAYWRPNPLLFLVVAAVSLFAGFQWFDTYTTNYGLAIAAGLMLFAFIALGFAIKTMFWKSEEAE